MLSKLLENSALYINLVATPRKRYFYDEIDHTDKLIGIIGARGVGKTTYILNYLKSSSLSLSKKLYLSADNINLANSSLVDIAKEFTAKGGRTFSH